MVDFDYFYRGLCSLARAHRAGAMAGHLGAAVVTGYFFGEDHAGLPSGVFEGIENELDRIIRGEEAIWFNSKKAGITAAGLFEPFSEEPADAGRIDTIAEALSANVDKTRQSGHNVIFAAAALRGLGDHPQFATPSIVDGIRKLIAQFNGAVPGQGYYGRERGWIKGDRVTLPPADGFPPYADLHAMAELVVDELIGGASVRRQGFGGLFHVINHAAGLVELDRHGYRDLARGGLAAHRQHVRLWRTLPDVAEELGPVEPSAHDPRTAEYWTGPLKRDSARLTHRIKTLYGFFTLLGLVEDPAKRKKAEKRFLGLMA